MFRFVKMFFILVSVFTLCQCANVTHQRGADANSMLEYYKNEKSEIQSLIDKSAQQNKHSGEITLAWTVTDSGRVEEARILKDEIENKELSQILLMHLKSLQFPKQSTFMKSQLQYTYRFSKESP